MANLWILNDFEELQTTLTSDSGAEGCRFWDAPFEASVSPEEGDTFSFYADATREESKYIVKDNKVVFKENPRFGDEFVMFTIVQTEEFDERDGKVVLATCEPHWYELDDDYIEDKRPTNKTPQQALDIILENTRYVGVVDKELQNLESDTFYQMSGKEAIIQYFKTWGGAFKAVVEFDGNKITKRIIKCMKRNGAANGVRLEHDRNVTNIRRVTTGYPKTAVYPYGASLEMTDEEGNATGGYTRYIDIADVTWSTKNGDPVDKPKGQKWIGDPGLLQKFGREKDGKFLHRFVRWQDENIKTPEDLIKAGYNALMNSISKDVVNYEVVAYVEGLKLGDTAIVIDRDFSRPIEVETDVIKLKYDVAKDGNDAEMTLGQFLEFNSLEKRVGEIDDKIRRNEGNWNSGGTVTDDNFPDTKPPVPTNVVARGLFSKVAISWDFEPYSYIAAYEVHGSQINGFTPSDSTILFAGKEGGAVHNADVDQKWYYRVRAINTHGTSSDFSEQVSATTVRIGTNHIDDLSITNVKIGEAAVDSINVAKGAITNAHIVSLIADKVKGGILSGVIVRSDNDRGDTIELKDGTFTSKLNGNAMIKMYNYNLMFFDPGTDMTTPDYGLTGAISPVWDSGDSTERGIAFMGAKDYLTLSKQTSSTESVPFLRADFTNRITKIGGAPSKTGSWDGRLVLQSVYNADWGKDNGQNAYVPKVRLENFNASDGTKYANVAIYTGRGPDAPNADNERFGFEVWQYTGHGSEAEQLFKIDRSSSQGRYMGFYGDTTFLPARTILETGVKSQIRQYAIASMLTSQVTDVRGGISSNAVLGFHYWDGITLNKGSGKTAYGNGTMKMPKEAKNVYWATAMPYGSYSDCVTVGITTMNTTEMEVRVRGSGAVDVEGKQLERLMVAYLYQLK